MASVKCYCLATVLLATMVASFPAYLNEGEGCSTAAGEPGRCRRLHECGPVMESVMHSKGKMRHTRCGFVGFEEVVCCPRTAPQRSPMRTRRSLKACEEYRSQEKNLVRFLILTGEETQEGEFPHMAALGYAPRGQQDLEWKCGGSLISDEYVLTAAHCINDTTAGSPVMVRLGMVDIGEGGGAAADGDYGVERITVHPRYKRKFHYNDIALIKLATKARLSNNVFPACLNTQPLDDGTVLIATGWGSIDAAGTSSSRVLLKANVSSVSLNSCRTTMKPYSKLPEGVRDDMLCAGDPKGKSDTCRGDSGGPLQLPLENSSLLKIAGITSFGPSPCGGRKPSVYTRVSSYVDWIEAEVWP